MKKKFHKIVGNNPKIRNVRRRIRSVAAHNLNVVIIGEAGTEKDLVSREIHRKSLRKPDIYETLDCHELIFPNHTAAREKLIDVLIAARGGTLFIDNIEKMPEHIQNELYRLTTETNKQTGIKTFDVRIISGTCNTEFPLRISINSSLLLHICEYEIRIPPLRERSGDIPLLFDYYYSLFCSQRGYSEPPAISDGLICHRKTKLPRNRSHLLLPAIRYHFLKNMNTMKR